jgi:uncharacterized protein YndB with AHSA1/START domain
MAPYLTPTAPDDRVLTITRTFDAPRTLVWRAFADPFHLSRWWGPKGYTNPVCELDFRVGGRWRNVMRSPEGQEFPTDFTFIEIVPPERIVFRNSAVESETWKGNPPPSFVRTITLTESGGRTTLTMRAEFATVEEKARTAARGFVQGTDESFDRLAALLAATSD